MTPTIPTELAEARRAREQAWNEYQQVLDAPHTHEEFTAALDKACAADKEVNRWYDRWQAVGGTSDITSIEAAEIERENAAITDWLQADNAAAQYGAQTPPDDYRIFNRRRPDGTYPPLSEFFDRAARSLDPRTDTERAADEDWQDEQNTREAVRPGY